MALSLRELMEPFAGVEKSDSNPFQEEPFQSIWFDHLARKSRVIDHHGDFVTHHKKVAKGLLRLTELKNYASEISWFNDFGQAQLDMLLAYQDPWDYLYTVFAESRTHLQLFSELEKLGYPVIYDQDKPLHVVDITGGYDAYLSRKTSKYRYHVKQKLKKAAPLQPRLVRYTRFEDIEPFFEAFFADHIPYWQKKTGYSFFSDPREQAFTIAWNKALFQSGKLILHALLLKDEIVNRSVSFVEGKTLYWPLTINTGRYLEYYPGLISLYLRLQEAADSGIETFQMGFGDFLYKSQSETHTDARRVAIVINPKSIKGQLFGVWARYKSQKRLLLRGNH